MKIAVTGCSGFVGSELIKKLLLDNSNTIVHLSSSIKSKNYNFWQADMPPVESAKLLKNCDMLIHLAAHIPAKQDDFEEASKCLKINTLGTLSMLRACILANVKRFVYISSFNIFSYEDKKNNLKIASCNNAPYYLGSKLLGEIYVKSKNFSQLSTLIIRPSSIYGYQMKSGVLKVLIDKLIKKEEIILNNNGEYKSDFLYLSDCVAAIKELSLSNYIGEVDIGSGVTTNILAITNYIAEILSVKKNIILLPKNNNDFRGYEAVDLKKLRSIINFEPTNINDGLKKMISKY